MNLGTMLSDLAQSLVRRPATRRYPTERASLPARLRGALRFYPEKCTGCGICEKDCPATALQLFTIDKAAKRFVLRYEVARCAFCGQCVISCRHGALELAGGPWELAAAQKDRFSKLYGAEDDVRVIMAGRPAADARPSATA